MLIIVQVKDHVESSLIGLLNNLVENFEVMRWITCINPVGNTRLRKRCPTLRCDVLDWNRLLGLITAS